MEKFEEELTRILDKAIGNFNPSIEDDISIITIAHDSDNNKLFFGGLKLRDDLEENGDFNEKSKVFYEQNLTSFNGEDPLEMIVEILNSNDELKEKYDGKILYGWCKSEDDWDDLDNIWSY